MPTPLCPVETMRHEEPLHIPLLSPKKKLRAHRSQGGPTAPGGGAAPPRPQVKVQLDPKVIQTLCQELQGPGGIECKQVIALGEWISPETQPRAFGDA